MNQVEELSLNDAATHLLEECRTIVPGMQALFGFQLIAVFSQGSSQKLSSGEQRLHLFAIALVVIAIGLVMAPAALHRQAEPQSVSQRFISAATTLMLWSMPPLALAISIDVYVVARAVFETRLQAALIAAVLLLVLTVLWFVLPRSRRLQRTLASVGPDSKPGV